MHSTRVQIVKHCTGKDKEVVRKSRTVERDVEHAKVVLRWSGMYPFAGLSHYTKCTVQGNSIFWPMCVCTINALTGKCAYARGQARYTLVCIAGQQAVASLRRALVPLERCPTQGRCPCVRTGGSVVYTHKYPPTGLVGSILVQLNTSRGAFRGGGRGHRGAFTPPC